MTRYHLNPETGNPGVCVALQRCRYGESTPHYDSQEAARAAYAFSHESLGFTVKSKRSANELSPAVKIEAQRLKALLEADLQEVEGDGGKFDSAVELRITRLGKFLAAEADKRAGFNDENFRSELASLPEDQKHERVEAMVKRITEANLSVLKELRAFGGEVNYRPITDKSSLAAAMVLEETVEKLYPSSWINASNASADDFQIIGIDAARASYGHRVPQPLLSPKENSKLAVVEPKAFYYIPVKAERVQEALALLGPKASVVDAPAYLENDGPRKVVKMPLSQIADEETPMEPNVEARGDEPATRPIGDGWSWGHYIDGDTDEVSKIKGWSKAIEDHEMVFLSTLRVSNPMIDPKTGELEEITERQRRTALHEFAHRIERTVPGIMRMEHAFLNRRTADEDGNLHPLDYIYPPRPTDSFMSSERGRFGGFVSSYIGKEYVDSPAREVFSVGIEAVLGGTYEALAGVSSEKTKDEDMRGFVMGLLASA